eukprot:12071074-Alexandrium_andersonii.AAC.1
MDPPFVPAGDEDSSAAYAPGVTVASWPVRSSSDACGWALFHRMADWAVHQARWLGAPAVRSGVGGAVALGVATLWAIVWHTSSMARTLLRPGVVGQGATSISYGAPCIFATSTVSPRGWRHCAISAQTPPK